MKRIILCFCSFILIHINLSAQNYQGISLGNRSGIQGGMLNPAQLMSNRSFFSFNLLSSNIYVNNSAMKFDMDSIIKGTMEIVDTTLTDPISYAAPLLNLSLPSFHFKIKDKIAFGFSSRVRFANQLDHMNPDLIDMIDQNVNGFYTKSISDPDGFNINVHAFSDMGLTMAYKVLDINKLKLSVGASVRYYSGLAYFNFENKGLTGQYYEDLLGANLINIDHIDWDISTSVTDYTVFEDQYNNPNDILKNAFGSNAAGKGWGTDLGAELLLKPLVNTKNKPYFLKLGASVTDIGSIVYKDVERLRLTGSGWANVDSVAKYYTDLDNLENQFYGTITATHVRESKRSKLPTLLSVYGDWCVSKRFFIQALAQGNIAGVNDIQPHFYTQFMIAPRLETKLLDAALPITYNEMSKDVKLGLAMRFTYLTVGSDDLNLLFSDAKGANFYFKLQFHIGKKSVSEEGQDATPVSSSSL